MSGISFYDRMKQFHLALPCGTPSLVKHVASVMFTFACDDGRGIFASMDTIMAHCGESERSVQRAIAFMTKAGWLEDDGWQEQAGGRRTKRRRLILQKILDDKAAEGDNSCEQPDLLGDNSDAPGVTIRALKGDRSDVCNNIDEPRENREKEPRGRAEKKSARGSRIHVDWHPNLAETDYAISLGLDPQKVRGRFVDFWLSKPGKDGVKLDWSATWRNWCRSAAERGQDLASKPNRNRGESWSL